MDEIDFAQGEIEYALLAHLHSAYQLAPVEATGACLNCGDAVGPQQRWCDSNCRDDWARYHAPARRLA